MIYTSDKIAFAKVRGFLVLDGVNGAGKSTLAKRIGQFLNEKKLSFLFTQEPGGSQLGSHIRKILLESDERLSPRSELLMFTADRAEHVDKVIRPALENKTIVISDRYYYSSEAFQGYGRGLALEPLRAINAFAIDNCLPDLTILLDLDPAEGLRRASKRVATSGADKFENEELEFHTRLRQGFIEIADRVIEPFLVLDGSKSQEQIFAQLEPVLERWVAAVRTSRD